MKSTNVLNLADDLIDQDDDRIMVCTYGDSGREEMIQIQSHGEMCDGIIGIEQEIVIDMAKLTELQTRTGVTAHKISFHVHVENDCVVLNAWIHINGDK